MLRLIIFLFRKTELSCIHITKIYNIFLQIIEFNQFCTSHCITIMLLYIILYIVYNFYTYFIIAVCNERCEFQLYKVVCLFITI